MPKAIIAKSRMKLSQKDIEIIDRLSAPTDENVTFGPPPKTAPLSVRTKWRLQQVIVRYMVERHLNQVQMAELLHEDRSIVNKIARGRLDGFSIDRLTDLVERIYPKADLKVSAG